MQFTHPNEEKFPGVFMEIGACPTLLMFLLSQKVAVIHGSAVSAIPTRG
jgi:hypothetical protein